MGKIELGPVPVIGEEHGGKGVEVGVVVLEALADEFVEG